MRVNTAKGGGQMIINNGFFDDNNSETVRVLLIVNYESALISFATANGSLYLLSFYYSKTDKLSFPLRFLSQTEFFQLH